MKNIKILLSFILVFSSIESTLKAMTYHTTMKFAAKNSYIERQKSLVNLFLAHAKTAQYSLALDTELANEHPENSILRKKVELGQIRLQAYKQAALAAQKNLDKHNESYKKSEDFYKKTKGDLYEKIAIFLSFITGIPFFSYHTYEAYYDNLLLKANMQARQPVEMR